MSEHKLIVPGGLNTDIIGMGVSRLIGAGELTLGGELRIGPGGKARNMAQMAAKFLGKGKVAMIGRSCKDPFGFWKYPINSLKEAGVDISQVKILDFEASGGKYPGIALIPVDRDGRNQIYVLPGVNADFGVDDIAAAEPLFRNHEKNKTMLLALEIPLETANFAIRMAMENQIKVILDPGGITEPLNDLAYEGIFVLKPNEHETEILTGMMIHDFRTAQKAAEWLLEKGVKNVLITHGARGGYFFNQETAVHIPIPPVIQNGVKDETGCGDQVSAIIAACLAEGKELLSSIQYSILAGTLQFYRSGIQPLSRDELESEAQIPE